MDLLSLGRNERDSFSDQVTGGREVAAVKMEEERMTYVHSGRRENTGG